MVLLFLQVHQDRSLDGAQWWCRCQYHARRLRFTNRRNDYSKPVCQEPVDWDISTLRDRWCRWSFSWQLVKQPTDGRWVLAVKGRTGSHSRLAQLYKMHTYDRAFWWVSRRSSRFCKYL